MLLTNRKHTSVTFYQPVWCGTGRLERDTACHNPAFYLLWDLWSTYFSSLEPVSSSLKWGEMMLHFTVCYGDKIMRRRFVHFLLGSRQRSKVPMLLLQSLRTDTKTLVSSIIYVNHKRAFSSPFPGPRERPQGLPAL